MNDKGFTLIEIIAVIIILGILMIITIPSISNFISDSRNSAYHSHEKSMEEAAKSYTIECVKNNEQNCLIPREGEEITLLLGELEDKDFLDKLQDPAKQGTYCNPEESYVKIKKSDDVDFEYTACLYCGSYATENSKCFKIEVAPTTIQCGTDIIGAGESWTKEPRTISINCVDTGNSCKQERFEKTFGTTMEYGDITIYDMNPSRGTKSCRVPVRIDLEKPTCSLDVTGDKRSGYYVDDVTVSMPSSNRKDNHSGVGAYGLGTSSNNPKYDNKENITISSNGVTRVFGYIKDIVGNEEICSTSITKVGKYYIIYDKNTGNGTMADTECIFGENCKLRKNTFTKTGYHFNYWSMLENGETAKHYSDEETVKNLTFSDKVRLYVIWEINQNTLVVNANSGTGEFTVKQNYNTTKEISVSRTGYTFDGWEATGTCGTYTNAATTTYTFPPNKDTTCTLKAKWKINTNSLVVDANGGTGGFSKITQNYNTTKAINVSRTGYTFDGWEASGTCGSYTQAATTTYTFPPNKDTICTLKAKWKINTSKLAVDANGGTGGFEAVTQNYNTTKEVSVSRTGHTFTSWTATGTCGTYTNAASTTYTFPANNGTTCTLKANWQIHTNTLVVDANGGTGGFTVTQNYNTTKAISVSKAHFVFDGWDASGTCGSYTEAASTTYTFPANSGTTCTLKAKWKAAPLATITCSDKDFTGSEQIGCSCTGGTIGGTYKATNAGTHTASCAADDSHTSPDNKNWKINKVPATLSCSNKYYIGSEQIGCSCSGGTEGGTYKATNVGTYTASCTGDGNHTNPANKSWKISLLDIKITLNKNGGTGGDSLIHELYAYSWNYDVNGSPGSVIDQIAKPTKDYYHFDGYYINGVEIIDKDGNVSVSNTYFPTDNTVTASWTPYKATVYYKVRNSETLVSPTYDNEGTKHTYVWGKKSNKRITVSKDGGEATVLKTVINCNEKIGGSGLVNYRSKSYLKIEKTSDTSKRAVEKAEWIKKSTGETFNQAETDKLTGLSFCDCTKKNCSVNLLVNWQEDTTPPEDDSSDNKCEGISICGNYISEHNGTEFTSTSPYTLDFNNQGSHTGLFRYGKCINSPNGCYVWDGYTHSYSRPLYCDWKFGFNNGHNGDFNDDIYNSSGSGVLRSSPYCFYVSYDLETN